MKYACLSAFALIPTMLISIASAADGPATSPAPVSSDKTVFVVAADGTGEYKTVQSAIDAIPVNTTYPKGEPALVSDPNAPAPLPIAQAAGVFHRVTIHIKPGTYKEVINFPANKSLITLEGEDAKTTILTFNNTHQTLDSGGKEIGTSKCASVFVRGLDFIAHDITFENSAGPVGQAVALNIYGDRGIYVNCRLIGWQDTLYTNDKRQYFRDCYISGHVDFIFGKATAWFKDCEIHCRAKGSITAAATPQTSEYGYVFDHCKVTSEAPPASVILGRPWRDYGATIFLNTELPDCITPAGWDDWGVAKQKTARYSEFNSTGPGAAPTKRAPWTHQLTADEAKQITVEKVLAGDDQWNPEAEYAAEIPGATDKK